MGSKGKAKAQDGGRYRDLPDEEDRIGDDPEEARRWEQEEQQVRAFVSCTPHQVCNGRLIVIQGNGTSAGRYIGGHIRDTINIGLTGGSYRPRSRRTKRVSTCTHRRILGSYNAAESG